MKRCHECGGRFGLVIYRHFSRRFCRKACKERYMLRMRQPRREARSDGWLAYLTGTA